MVSVREKVLYGLGDTASNIIFQTVLLFLAYFYTDIYGLSGTMVGVLFLTVRIFDAVTDPLMGALTDRTHTRYGQFRPYILWLAVPFGVISVVAFTTPDFSQSGKIIYAFITYGLLMAAYTAINIPYSALGGVLSSDINERVSIQSYRFVFGMLGGLFVTALTLPMVDWLGQGNKALGYQLTMGVLSTLGVMFFLLCFWGTRERHQPVRHPKKNQVWKDVRALFTNSQVRVLCTAVTVLMTAMILKSTLAIYYVKYVLGREDFITWFISIGMVGNILGCALASRVSRHIEKVTAYRYLQYISALLCLGAYFVPSNQWIMATLLYFLWGFFLQMATPMLWAKMADTADYCSSAANKNLTGMVFSTIVFFIKLGIAFGGAFASGLLDVFQYMPNVEQQPATQQQIQMAFTLFPAVGFCVVGLLMNKYHLTHDKIHQLKAQSQPL
ncbi:Inner membrane symporter [Saliniradius amylolyticus]|uniref:Inner membrane symporter n=1 Tax=Saliniradius amylolyticus TaxID=2183582 RepID=A0A2S2E189_9ALTE|nr:glycoside-pentoside-hexuronide (GPH):cation symporter [Saliniradius amylolyticus]AWL11386.1 Inner membrane symporter [Saliniradius amylolyticus]